ncbi:ArsR/SmtB family transcription factor [Nostoc sp. MG11]|uniref:ArsR/SmtB family transcription factor n=1 Tax=Nostoc sp. MG11 TaxID=2721166 RepID=UPI001866703B|nr:metalloregulator ArsR/SmtB family transcription factor [Nostoc sp. MG11]
MATPKRTHSDCSNIAINFDIRTTVNEIVEATGLSQSNVSNHLNCLRCCNLVIRQQQGRFVYYQLSDQRIAKLLDLADELLGDVAKGVNECSRYDLDEGG